MITTPNIDDFVKYREEYTRYVQKAKVAGNKMTGLCPFHDDKKNSFSVDLATGMWHCFSEDIGGNYIDFYARIHNTDTKTAYREICKEYGVELEPPPEDVSYTLERYSNEKQIPIDWLKEFCRLSTETDKRLNATYVRMPYFDKDNKLVTYRKRFSGAGNGKCERTPACRGGSFLLQRKQHH